MLLQKYKDMAMETPRGKVALEIVAGRWEEWDKMWVGCNWGPDDKKSIRRTVKGSENLAAKIFFEALWRYGVMEEPERGKETYEIQRLDMWLEKIFYEEALKIYKGEGGGWTIV